MSDSKEVLGIGIETSCDETGIAVVSNGKTIIEDFLFSQEKIHAEYGGVVPEIASRNHLITLPILFNSLLKKNTTICNHISYVSATVRPGLVGSLLIGYNCGLAISQVLNKPFIPVHHLEAHIYATFMENDITPQYPFVSAVISGGNTILYYVKNLGNFEVIGETLDDAAGEALDKAAKMLGLSYPGGKIIDENANIFYQKCLEKNYTNAVIERKNPFPKLLQKEQNNNKSFDFSFSGLKTALRYYLKDNSVQENSFWKTKKAICFFYLQRIIQSIIKNLKKTILFYPTPYVIVAGGVCANSFLRRELQSINKKVYYPSSKLCTDNGAMVAACSYHYYINNITSKDKVTSNRNFSDWLE